MKKILLYTPFNSRSRDTESVMEYFVQQGHEVFLLTQAPWGDYHEAAKKLGVKCFVHALERRSALLYFLRHTLHLLRFIRQHRIDVVFAHLENAGLPAVLARYFCPARIIVCRHIVDEAYLFRSRNFILQNRIVYRLAPEVIVVSNRAKQFMIEQEQVAADKIAVIRLAYNFDLYPRVDLQKSAAIRAAHSGSLLLISICRLVPSKRPDLSIALAERLSAAYPGIRLLILGNGPMQEELRSLIRSKGLEKNIFLTGHVPNVLDYLSAADVLIHPSLLDSSSVTVKEAGLLKKPVIACRDIGDLDEYMVNYESGLLLDKDHFVEEAEKALLAVMRKELSMEHWGEHLQRLVLERFSISVIGKQYSHYLK